MWKKVIYILIALAVTLLASIYQRKTGPTYPKSWEVVLDGVKYTLSLPRSGGEKDCEILLKGLPKDSKVLLFWRLYPSQESYIAQEFKYTNDQFKGVLPVQPPAGKLEYYVSVNDKDYFKEEPLIIRFKGDVPAGVLVPHVLFMFAAMFMAAYTLLKAIFNLKWKKSLLITILLLLVGGFLFGPLVQKHAFGIYWSGIPFGTDLTDNKTLFAMVALLVAWFFREKIWGRWVAVLAVLILFVIYSIPHSLGGSEYNHETGKVGTEKLT